MRCTSAYQIWSKSDNSRLRYGDNAIFKMAAVRHLEFEKIAILLMWPISACDLSSSFQISLWSANMAPRYGQKNCFQYGVRPPSWICKISIFLLNANHGNWNLHLSTKFDRNRIILGWDMGIILFSKWRRPPSWIFENYSSGHVAYIGMWSFISVSNFAFIGQYGVEI